MATAGARLALLLAGAVAAGRLATPLAAADVPTTWPSAIGWSRVIIGAAMVVAAVRGPSVVSDAWFEYRFRRGIADYQPLPPTRFALTAALLAAGSFAVLVAGAGVGYRLARSGFGRWGRPSTLGWLVLLAVLVAVVMAVVALVERPVRARLGDEAVPDPSDGAGDSWPRLWDLAERFGIDRAALLVAAGSETDGAMTASAQGLGANGRVVVAKRLLDGDADIRHFVTAHELAHLDRRHVATRTAAAWLATVVMIGIVIAMGADGRLWRWFDLSSLDPLGLPVVALVVGASRLPVELAAAWLSRAQERSADAGAVEAAVVPDADALAALYLDAGVDLDPPRWAQWLAEHPPPGERLELLSRYRRARTGSIGGQGRSTTR